MNDIESFDKTIRLIKLKWKLLNRKLVKNVLSDEMLNVLKSSKNAKKLNVYKANVIRYAIMFLVNTITIEQNH